MGGDEEVWAESGWLSEWRSGQLGCLRDDGGHSEFSVANHE